MSENNNKDLDQTVIIDPNMMNNNMPGQSPMGQGMPGQPPMGQGMPGQPPMGTGMPSQSPMGQGMPMGQPPMGQGMPMGQLGMGQSGMNQGMPMGQPGMNQGMPMGTGMPGQPPMGQPPMGQGMPMGQPPMGAGMPGQPLMGQPGMNPGIPGQPPMGQGMPMNQQPPRPPKPPKPPKEKKPMSKKTKIIIAAVLAVIVIAAGTFGFLYMNLKKDKVDEDFIKANIPAEIITYTLDGKEITAEIEKIKFLDQDSKMYEDTAECEITLKDTMLERTLECKFESKRSFFSKWKCENIEYDADDIEAKFTKELAAAIATANGYTGTDYEKYEELKDNKIGFSYFVEKKYDLCTVSGRVSFEGEIENELVDGKLLCTTNTTADSSNMNCAWAVTGGEFKQKGSDVTELGVNITVYGDEIDATYTTSQFGNQDGYGYINTQYDDKGEPYTEISFEKYATDLTGKDVDITYTLLIGANAIKSAKVSSDTNQTYYECDLEEGSYDIEVTRLYQYGDESFAINNRPIEIMTFNSESENILNYFIERFPEYKDLIVHTKYAESEAVEEVNCNTILEKEDRPSIIYLDSECMVRDDVLANAHLVPVANAGISKERYANAFDYAVNYGSYNGELKALTSNLCPGGFYYRRDIAEEVLGTDDPDEIQSMIKDWDSFNKVALKMKKKGYAMIPSSESIKYPYFATKTGAWVDGDKFTADASIADYVKQAKHMETSGYTEKLTMWEESWVKPGKSFGDFCSNWSMYRFENDYDYGLCKGPESFVWGGTYAAITDNCANPGLAELFLYVTCCDRDFVDDMLSSSAFTNSEGGVNAVPNIKELVEDCADYSSYYGANYYCGQNTYEIYMDVLDSIDDVQFRTKYDYNISGIVVNETRAFIEGKYKKQADVIKAIEAGVAELLK